MEKHPSDLSANDLLARLKANMEAEETAVAAEDNDRKKKYKFRRSERPLADMTEEEIRAEMPQPQDGGFVSPVPKSDIEDLDLDALMKKYLPEEDYERMTSAKTVTTDEEEAFVRTLSSIEMVEEPSAEDELTPVSQEDELTAPDSELYDRLSEGGKVCDVPGMEDHDEMSDTRQAPLRPMSEADRTLAFGTMNDEEGGFISVRELLAAETVPLSAPISDQATESSETEERTPRFADEAPTSTVSFVDDAPTSEMPLRMRSLADEVIALADEAESEEDLDGTVIFDHASERVSEEESEPTPVDETAVFAPFADVDALDTVELPAWIEEETRDLPPLPELSTEPALEEEATTDEWVEEEPLVTEIAEEEPIASVTEEASVLETPTEEPSFEEVFEGGAVVPVDEDEEPVRGDQDFDETDANLMLAFGMDEELEAAIGKESADKLRSEMDHLMADEEEKVEKIRPIPEPEPVKEFVSPAETKDILDAYKNEYGKSALRMFGVIAVALILFFYENIGLFGGKLIDALNPAYYPVVHIMVGLQVLLIGFAVLYRSVIDGVKGLWNRRPTAESYLPLLLVVAILYSVCACFFPAGASIVSFHFPIALCLLFEVIGERLNLRREIMAFRVVSSKRTKFALEKLDIDDAELETKAFDRFLPKQPDIFRINKTAFVDGYFARTKRYPSIKLALNAYLPALIIALVAGLIVGFVTEKSFAAAVTLAYAAFAFAMPATVFFTFSLPAFRAGKIAYAENSAIVGEAALDEYTSAASISFDDREVFPTAGVKLRSIKVFGSGRLDTAIYYLAAVYSQIGGPLADVLRVATADLGHAEDVEVLTIEDDGVEALVDRHHLYVGKSDYLRHNGYLPVSDPDDEEIESGDTSIFFLVCDDEVVAKIYVRYRIDPEFERTLKNLYRSGICVGIKTVDPNINDDMLSTRIRLSKYPVRVLKYSDIGDTRHGSERTDSGIVSRKSVKALLRAFTLCDKIKHITKTNLLINALTMLIGLLLVLSVAFLGSIGAVSSVYVALFQLFWLLPTYLITKFLLM